jgi:hypothetical protein
MQHTDDAGDADPALSRIAPAFRPEEKPAIFEWARQIRRYGMRVEIRAGYKSLREAVLVIPQFAEEPLWLLHKTPEGAVAVRMWPGLADIVATVPEGLAMVSAALAQRGDHDATAVEWPDSSARH